LHFYEKFGLILIQKLINEVSPRLTFLRSSSSTLNFAVCEFESKSFMSSSRTEESTGICYEKCFRI
jgi:hypothetical protein